MSVPRLPLCAFAAALLLVLPGAAAAQLITGRALDESTGLPLPDVSVSAIAGRGEVEATVVTDSAGSFRIVLRRGGAYRLRARHVEYAELVTAPVRVGASEMVAVDLTLGRTVIALEPLVVTGRGPVVRDGIEFYRRRAQQQQTMGLGRHITRRDIEETAVASVNDLLRRDIRVDIVPIDRPFTRQAIMMRGRGDPCFPMLYLNGMRLGRADAVDLASMVDIDDIEGIEVYRGAVETPVDIADHCGAVAVWYRAGGSAGHPFSLRRVLMAAGFVGLVLITR